jgi:xylan 1,4-beta-xylosidase
MRRTPHLAILALLFIPISLSAQSTTIAIDAHAGGTAFPHFWERMFGSGRAILTLRDSYRQDLRTVREATGFEYVRFHAIFHDETGFYALDPSGKPIYNFSYIDQIYDGLLDEGVRPFVELSFTPKALASDPAALHAFWYKQNVSPPKDYALWDEMIRQFTQHLVDRYGLDEVAQWYFEVWNEPNIDFWSGNPKQATYFELYDHTAKAVKAVSPRLLVGGPATAQAAWVADFLAHTKQNDIPVDFVSSHVYGNDSAQDVFKTNEHIPQDQMVARAVARIHAEILASPYPKMPLIMSEYNATYTTDPDVTDTVFMGPWLANNIRLCDGLADIMSYWAVSDVFEEQGVVKTPFYGGYGLVAEDNILKPALNAFSMLHRLGETRLSTASDSALVTRHKDGSLVLALWNYQPPSTTGPTRAFDLTFTHISPTAHVTIQRLDEDHGNVLKTFDAMHRPAFPSRLQIEQLRAAAQPAAPETAHLRAGKLHLAIPPHGLVVIEVK